MTTPVLNADMARIIEVTNELLNKEGTAGSTGEIIAAAFILDDASYLPNSYPNMIDAWDRLGAWQEYVRVIRAHYRHLIVFKA
jgi:hypothetical protein